MKKETLNGFKYKTRKTKGKIRKNISIDKELNQLLKKEKINVSGLINELLWYYYNKELYSQSVKKTLR